MMRRYRYIKSNAFTAGESLGNPAACLFLDDAPMTGEQMQSIASEHKGFVMEMVFCGQSEKADAKLTYYSSECEVDFCGHGTIATMYSLIKDTPELMLKPVVMVETNRKGMIEVYNAIKDVADLRGYQLVLDRASDTGIIFGSPKIDISDEVLRKLGYSY